jgi:hypothetical protein
MNAVLYTHDMEPITVVDLQPWVWDRLKEGGHVNVYVKEPFRLWSKDDYAPQKPRVVTITGELFRRRGVDAMMLFTHDEESALMLKASFLPGQRGTQQAREREAFANGFVDALMKVSRL